MPTPPITIHEQLAGQLRRGIWAGEFEPGQRLREVHLAEQFGVSRGPIRDVFLRLTREGLLRTRPNAGVSVSEPPSPFQRQTLVQLRRTIECNALRQVLRSGIDALLSALRDNLEDYEAACRKERLDSVVELDLAFHRAIVASADNGSLIATWLPVISQMFLRYSRHHSLIESYNEHAAIVAAIAVGNRAAAVRALRQHIV